MRKLIESLFFPAFLRQLDEKLLVERPSLWATRLHRVAWPAFLLLLSAVGLGLLTPINQPGALGEFVWMGSILIFALQFTLIIFWLYRQDAYHLEREHGLRENQSVWKEFGSWVAALTMIGFALFAFIATSQFRVRAIPKNMLARDIVILNTLHQLHHSEYSSHYDSDRNHKCPYGKADGFADCLNRASDNFVEGNFGRISSFYPDEQEFVAMYVSADDFVPLQREWRDGDYNLIIETIAKYDDDSLEQIESRWDIENNITASIYGARNALSNDVLDFAYDEIWNIWSIFWLVVGTAAIHISLLRFTFKYAGRKWFFITGAVLTSLFIFRGFFSFFSYLAYELLGYYRYHWPNLGVLLLGLIVSLAFVIRLRKQSQFSSKTAIALYLLPAFLVAGSYYLLFIGEELSFRWIQSDFKLFYRHNDLFLGFSLDDILTYVAQFGYVPFLGWLKQKHTRLMSLPR